MSDDGRYIAFGSYIWDSQTRATTLMGGSRRSNTPPYCDYYEAPLDEGYAVLTGDGQHGLYFLPPLHDSGWRMHVWNRSDGTSRLITDQPVTSSSITDDGSYVAYAPFEGIIDFLRDPTVVIRWNRSTGEHEVIAKAPEGKSVRSSRISGDGSTIYYEVGEDPQGPGPFEIFRWQDGQSEKIAQGSIHDVSDDGNTILLTTTDGLVLWSNGTLTVLAPRPAEGLINLARLSGDGRVVVWQRQESSDPDGPAAVYRKEVGKDAVQIISYPNGSRATAFALPEDGARLAYAERDDPTDEWAGGVGVFLR